LAARLQNTPDGGKRTRADKHGWNTYENYKQIHDTRLANHPFVDHTKPDNLEFELFLGEDGLIYASLSGEIYCKNNVVLYVRKIMETRVAGKGRIQVRGLDYCYNAKITGKCNILRYDNAHEFEDYHKHIFDMNTNKQVDRISLNREEFPNLSDVLDELASMFS
jgi:hypothetical protein